MYSKKYFKYKQKYVNLKNKIINQVGGAGRTILFTFNDNYITVYQYTINTAEDDFNAFKRSVLKNPEQCSITDNSFYIPITDSGYFSALPPFTVLNILTPLSNISDEIHDKIYNLQEDMSEGPGTPVHRTLSYEAHQTLIDYTQRKLLNIFLYDVHFSQIDFYRKDDDVNNYLKIKTNYNTTETIPLQCEPKIQVTFDSGNGGKTTIASDLAKELGCKIEPVKPDPNFIQFCINNRQLFQDTVFEGNNFNILCDYLIRNHDMNSREIYNYSKIFLDEIKKTNLNKYYEFIRNLNLLMNQGVSSIDVGGFELTKFYILIKGTEQNFTNRKGVIIPLTVEAHINEKESNFILINARTIQTLEYYKLFLFISDKHTEYKKNTDGLNLKYARLAAVKKKYNMQRFDREGKMDDDMLKEKVKTLNQKIDNFLFYKSSVEKMECKQNFYKFDIKNSRISLLVDRQYVEPTQNYKVIFDTGNESSTLINPKFINNFKKDNPTMNFNEVTVKPLPSFYEFILNVIKESKDERLTQILNRWSNKETSMSSAQIYGEFIGSTSFEFQNTIIDHRLEIKDPGNKDQFTMINMKDVILAYLSLKSIGDANRNITVLGGTSYKFNLKIDTPPNTPPNTPSNIEITAYSTDFIKPIVIEGSRVLIKGIQNKPELNGRTGTIIKFDEDKNRWEVKLDIPISDRSIILLNLDKLENISPKPVQANIPFDILVSVYDVKKFNQQAFFIGNLREKNEAMATLQYLEREVEQINPDSTDPADIQKVRDLMNFRVQNKKFNAERIDCMDDVFVPTIFYVKIITIAYKKLLFTLDNFKNQVKDLMKMNISQPDLKKYNDVMRKLETHVSFIGGIPIEDISNNSLITLIHMRNDLNTFKNIFIADLKIVVDIANEIRSKISSSTPQYTISNDFL
jgi:hypothetical protein